MTFRPDLEGYFGRIAYTGGRAPDYSTLAAIVRAHVLSIPFENLSVIAREGVSLEPADLERKLVREGRGGYCFEHGTYLTEVLRTLGFEVSTLLGRVRWNAPEGTLTPRTHMLLLVTIDGRRWLLDVGFGIAAAAPLDLDSIDPQETPHEPRRIVPREGGYLLQAKLGAAWRDFCEFPDASAFPVDFKVGNWYTSTHPDSLFTNHLTVTCARADARYALMDRQLTIRFLDGATTEIGIKNPEHLREILAGYFRLRLPDYTRLECAGLDWDG